jgi:hypothetical protein
VLTLVLFSISWLSGFLGGGSPAGYSDSQLDRLIFYDQLRTVTAFFFLLIQIIFLGYFVVQLLKKPVYQR